MGTWEDHGKFMGISWEIHGNIMGNSWEIHGNIMGISIHLSHSCQILSDYKIQHVQITWEYDGLNQWMFFVWSAQFSDKARSGSIFRA